MPTTVRFFLLGALFLSLFGACSATAKNDAVNDNAAPTAEVPQQDPVFGLPIEELDKRFPGASKAYFAGGCFWCTEAGFERIEGVIEVFSGYSGGSEVDPTYRQVASGGTSHAESVVVYFDPAVVSYETLLAVFFVVHDATQLNRQGPDIGPHYRSAIFYLNEEQEDAARTKIAELEESGEYARPIVTLVEEARNFYLAEDYHQDYYEQERPPNYGYVMNVTKPKVEKVLKTFPGLIKEAYRK